MKRLGESAKLILAVQPLSRQSAKKAYCPVSSIGTSGFMRYRSGKSQCSDLDYNWEKENYAAAQLKIESCLLKWKLIVIADIVCLLFAFNSISDFGLARWLPSEWTNRAVSPIEGSFGCLALEYFTHGLVDEKTDVFAFDIFLLELISGKKPVDGSHKILLSWAKPHLNDGNVHMLVDSKLGEYYDVNQHKRIAFVASLCIREISIWRPSTTKVFKVGVLRLD